VNISLTLWVRASQGPNQKRRSGENFSKCSPKRATHNDTVSSAPYDRPNPAFNHLQTLVTTKAAARTGDGTSQAKTARTERLLNAPRSKSATWRDKLRLPARCVTHTAQQQRTLCLAIRRSPTFSHSMTRMSMGILPTSPTPRSRRVCLRPLTNLDLNRIGSPLQVSSGVNGAPTSSILACFLGNHSPLRCGFKASRESPGANTLERCLRALRRAWHRLRCLPRFLIFLTTAF